MELEKLFHPIIVGNMRLKNRIVMSPMGTNYADNKGMVTSRLMAYFEARAKGGAAMITTGVTSIADTGKTIPFQLGVYSDDCMPGLTKLAKIIKANDCLCVLQLHHAGRRAASKRSI